MQKFWTVKIATGPGMSEYFAEQVAQAGKVIDIDLSDSVAGAEHLYVWVPSETREDAPRVITSALKVAFGTTFNLHPSFG